MAGRDEQDQREPFGEVMLPVFLAILGLASVGFLQLSPEASDRDVTAIFAPGTSFAEAAARVNQAGAAVLGTGPSGNIVIARLIDGSDRQALKENGAWLLLAAPSDEFCSRQEKPQPFALSQSS